MSDLFYDYLAAVSLAKLIEKINERGGFINFNEKYPALIDRKYYYWV